MTEPSEGTDKQHPQVTGPAKDPTTERSEATRHQAPRSPADEGGPVASEVREPSSTAPVTRPTKEAP
jgi:hypothetical protein